MDIINILEKLISDVAGTKALVEVARNLSHGEFASNVAMITAKASGGNPREVAGSIVSRLCSAEIIEKAEVAGPGFINIVLCPRVWTDLLRYINTVKEEYGSSDSEDKTKINIEYVSANPTGPIHIGHVRGAIIGDVLAQIMIKIGFDVTREYYINDAGSQVDVLARSAYLRYREALGHDIGKIPEGLYPGEYLASVGKELAKRFGDTLSEDDVDDIKQFAVEQMMLNIKNDLSVLRVDHDIFSSEKAMISEDNVNKIIDILRDKGLIYEDIPEKPKGKAENWVPRKQILFRSTVFGDEVDRAFTKADGSWTYFAADIVYNCDKVRRGYGKLVLILGRDHIGYAKRLQAAIEAITGIKAEFILYDIVNLMHGDAVIKMSKRKGTFLTAQDVMDVIGSDAIRFIMLSRNSEMVLDFDLEKAREATKDNPVFYIQYAYARACSVLRRGTEFISSEIDAALLNTESERLIMRMLAEWPACLRAAARKREPHRLVFYLNDLAKLFHAFWNAGTEDNSFRFIIPSEPLLTASRLYLVQAVTRVISSGLGLLKVKPLENM